MQRQIKQYKTIDAYINNFPEDVQQILQNIRKCILKAAPDAQEKISYGIPTFTLNGNLVHFAAYDHHIGFYPGADGIHTFLDDLKDYKTSKGAVQFPLDKPLPLGLITKITLYRATQNTSKKQ